MSVVAAFTTVGRVRATADMQVKQRIAHSTVPTSQTLWAQASIASVFTFRPWRVFFRTLAQTFRRLACSLVSAEIWIRGLFMRFTTHSRVHSESFAGLTVWPKHALQRHRVTVAIVASRGPGR